MDASLVLSLLEGVSLVPGDDGGLVVHGPSNRFTFSRVSAGLRCALEQLVHPGAIEDRLTDVMQEAEGPAGLARFYYYLDRLSERGLLERSAQLDGQPLATLTPVSNSFVFAPRRIKPALMYVLSRFAYMHELRGELVLESPLSHARISLHDWRAVAFIQLLAQPRKFSDIDSQIPALTDAAVEQLLTLLIGSQMVEAVTDQRTFVADGNDALATWEFHDLLFHSRSRVGRHDAPVGGTYRFAGQIDPPAALKPAMASKGVELYRPDLDRLRRDDPPFAQVQEARRSVREFGDPPITAEQLGEFLYRVGRVKEYLEHEIPTPNGPLRMDFAWRPYPGGGALYELELYAVVNACGGLESGFYHYDPMAHRLESISGRTPNVESLLQSASAATGIPAENLQVVLIIAARFQRVAWKYSSMAYAVILKHVGVLYQTMYLAATAMGLAPCGVGCGDSDLFCRAAGTDYYTESSVGEFLLGSKNPDAL